MVVKNTQERVIFHHPVSASQSHPFRHGGQALSVRFAPTFGWQAWQACQPKVGGELNEIVNPRQY
jgi:hypothetical protein